MENNDVKLISLGIFIGAIFTIFMFILLNSYPKDEPTEYIPVTKYKVDTLYIIKDTLINKVKYIEITKYDTIEKIYGLDDTASVNLFYELVSE